MPDALPPPPVPEAAVLLDRLMLAFTGTTVPTWLRERLGAAPAAGLSLFRAANLRNPRQVRRLTAGLQAAAGARAGGGSDSPLLIATDQEGGQLLALGDGFTAFGSPMAIGATRDEDLAERIGRAIGRELKAVGVNVDYAPVLDLATNPANPALGIRSFGDEPAQVGRLASAWLRGLQSQGVAAVGKHFPGAGEAAQDPHLALPTIEGSGLDLQARELVPFRAAVAAGARLVMSGHFATPGLTGSRSMPATLSRRLMAGVLRDELGFDGVTITDALDMGALPQDATQAVDVVAALASVDLLLATTKRPAQRRIESAIRRAAVLGLVDPVAAAASAGRIGALRAWLAGFEQPPLDVVGSAEHAALARELAARSLTLVRDDGSLPLRLDADGGILAVMPQPRDLTPADTSSFVEPGLGAALRTQHPDVDEIVISQPPTAAEIAAVVERAGAYDVVVLGTINASLDDAQAALANALIERTPRLVTVALRAPWDLGAYPGATTHVCTYSILPESLEALAAALFGRSSSRDPFPGRLPVAGIAGQAPAIASLSRT